MTRALRGEARAEGLAHRAGARGREACADGGSEAARLDARRAVHSESGRLPSPGSDMDPQGRQRPVPY